ncbi:MULTISPECIES: (2Fe-2S)-binding protein [Thermosphaera]|jgi:NAD(P)H-nitrite reductase large subunit|uniref:BFD domain protein (2Fe-2S)-binding domain protein n=2 Tax=Thermosphaera TaxID=54253 RepID=D5U191_THEAM|nr:(2Fe-2S)-binding protein [Thermosphaera aggregans]ADG90891.1 BFD domain protein (2Fe-2S)-binding domain protein [Thermosphaera aggregans DSM 11486]QOR93927.1 (2Fe-2S)-binding protein [Thermosphaera aggregans]
MTQQDPRKIIVCRCENVTLEQILRAIEEGFDSLELLKRKLRVGMGPCQGTTCLLMIARILMQKTGKSFEEVFLPVNRPPIHPVKLKNFIGGSREG